jgi:hypothetical protein
MFSVVFHNSNDYTLSGGIGGLVATVSISGALSKGSIGAYQLQAAIAAVHDEAARAEDSDWPQILALYELLKRMSDNPMVMLNHAVAAAQPHDLAGPPSALAGGGCQILAITKATTTAIKLPSMTSATR